MFKQFAWVPDGTYDYTIYQTRYVIVDGNAKRVISRSWIEAGGPNDVGDELKVPWGSYPDFPAKS